MSSYLTSLILSSNAATAPSTRLWQGHLSDVMESDLLGSTSLLAHVEEALEAVDQVPVCCLS